MKQLNIVLSLFVILFGLSVQPAMANPASGIFTPTRSCPMYHSREGRTNPGGAMAQIGKDYKIMEADQKNAEWFRVINMRANPRLRWVQASCGSTDDLVIED